jgi:Bacteriophage minor capsid protein
MSIQTAFVEYLEGLGLATLGQDLFVGEAPSSVGLADNIWWIVASGGTPQVQLTTGGAIKDYQVSVYYRNRDYKAVYDAMHDLEEHLNCEGCVQLTGFEVLYIRATTFPIDNDRDLEDRKVGLLQALIKVYAGCVS